MYCINPLNAELNPICHLLALLGAHRIFHVSGLRVKTGRLLLKCDGTRAETRFRVSAKRTSPFKSAGASVQSTTGSRGVRHRR